MTALVVTGTGTGVGPGQPGDVDEVRRLVDSPITCRELARYPQPLAPATAARRAGLAPVTPATAATAVQHLAGVHDLVLLEGTGGLLVPLDGAGGTLADVAAAAAAPVLVVVAAGLGTLNHTALTAEALRTRGLSCAGIVIGAWPAEPDLAARCNVADLPAVTGLPLLGALPEGIGRLPPAEFLRAARRGLESGLQALDWWSLKTGVTGVGSPWRAPD